MGDQFGALIAPQTAIHDVDLIVDRVFERTDQTVERPALEQLQDMNLRLGGESPDPVGAVAGDHPGAVRAVGNRVGSSRASNWDFR